MISPADSKSSRPLALPPIAIVPALLIVILMAEKSTPPSKRLLVSSKLIFDAESVVRFPIVRGLVDVRFPGVLTERRPPIVDEAKMTGKPVEN